jgi:hypothetical protein
MADQSTQPVSSLLQHLQPFTLSDAFGGLELREGQVHLYVVGGERGARSAGVVLDDALARGRLTIHDCPYSHRELAEEVKRLSSSLLTSTRPAVSGVVSIAVKADGTGLQITCRPGTSIETLRAVPNYPFDVEWGMPPTTTPRT